MKKKHMVLFCVCIVIAFVLGFVVAKLSHKEPEQTTVFYANTLEIFEKTLLVEGIPENDVNHRGQFDLSIGDTTAVLNVNGEPIQFSTIPTGSLVTIEYRGLVVEVSPAVIYDVVSIKMAE